MHVSCIQTYIHTYMHTHTYIHTYMHTYIHTCIHTYTHTCIQTYIHTYIHTYMHTHTYIRAYRHTYTHTCIQTYMHTYIHSYINTYINTFIRSCILAYMHTYLHTSDLRSRCSCHAGTACAGVGLCWNLWFGRTRPSNRFTSLYSVVACSLYSRSLFMHVVLCLSMQFGDTVLLRAACHGNEALVKELIGVHANLNIGSVIYCCKSYYGDYCYFRIMAFKNE
jgi:hypothetical protein